MCLYPKLILNKKYLPTKKNGFNPPEIKDPRLKYVAVGCGVCYECCKQKSNMWRIRMSEELKVNKYAYFVTMTFAEEELTKLEKEFKSKNPNYIASKAVRRFLERWRKKYKKSVKHWLITELGHKNTERIHLHGIIYKETPLTNEELQEIWKYGKTDTGKYVNYKTINYVSKYVTKVDTDHKGYIPQIFCSAGIGKNYTLNPIIKIKHKYKKGETKEYYTTDDGHKINLPIYYRNKLFNEETREKLWQDRLDKQIIYCNGIKIDISTKEGRLNYEKILKEQQKWNTEIGFENGNKWVRKEYQTRLEQINS